MIEFLKKINWKIFSWDILIMFVFLTLSYFAGNNKFPHNIWMIPVLTLGIVIGVLVHVYLDINKKEKNG